ncbi:MAG: sensor histidine kinase [Candidatus Aminicenantales bacterium]
MKKRRPAPPSLKESPQRKPAGAGSAEKDFHGYHAFLDALMDNISDYIYFKDLDSRFLRINAAHARAFGLSDPAQAIGKTDFDFFIEEHARQALEDEQKIIQTGRPIIGLVEKETRADGRVSWVSTTKMPLRDDQGQIIGTFGISRDITAQKLAEEALRNNEKWQRDILSSMADWVWEVDENGVYSYSSEKGEEILGASREDIIGKTRFDFMPPEEADRVARIFSEIMADKKVIHDLENWNIGRNGRRICLLTNGVPILDERGSLKGYRGVDKDITDSKRAEEEIKRQLAEKSILLKEVHHRIKNNIAAVASLLSLQMRSITNPEAVAALKEASSRVRSMGVLYDKLLLSEGQIDVPLKKYVESLVASVVSLFPGQPRIDLNLEIGDFYLNPKRLFPLGIIINELLTNAVKYAFTDMESGTIWISLTGVDKRVSLSVRDNGIGLPDGFDLKKSKGFGLMVVQMLCEQLDGLFSLEKNAGTRCLVTFDI